MNPNTLSTHCHAPLYTQHITPWNPYIFIILSCTAVHSGHSKIYLITVSTLHHACTLYAFRTINHAPSIHSAYPILNFKHIQWTQIHTTPTIEIQLVDRWAVNFSGCKWILISRPAIFIFSFCFSLMKLCPLTAYHFLALSNTGPIYTKRPDPCNKPNELKKDD